ncbi:MAG: glycerol-3-phosphate dehydrogenase/oxidase [Deltaproteobacteria bacterium]|nr:glycerol-3-phosphate dehydrogenase/oxidase [Deltaproteobacteria bacterium]
MEKTQINETIKDIKKNWDLIIIGGGITGAGILRETVRMDLNVLLVEQQDFAWGTSSRSSKLVHGGLRYLKEGKLFLTRDSIKERERLLKEAPGLVEPLGFMFPVYKGRGLGKWSLEAGLAIYDVIAKKRQHRFYDLEEFVKLEPHIDRKGLTGAFHFFDAYTAVEKIDRNDRGEVTGVIIKDVETHETKELSTGAVINATGCWAEKLHPSPKKKLHLRPLRGGHMIFPAGVVPVDQALSFSHPSDNRSVFMSPWEGAVIVGTTDLDHKEDLSIEPVITEEEVSYLMEGLHAIFPSLDISPDDCLSTIAGVRPVLSEGKLEPSQESREHVVWVDKGLVTITGGKLTTFRTLAFDALKAAKPFLPPVELPDAHKPGFTQSSMIPEQDMGLPPETWGNLFGRYGEPANNLVREAALKDLKVIPGTRTLWAELPYVAKNENVRHLADLMLRRVRIGLLTPNGGREHLGRVRKLVAPVLPWDRKGMG